MGRKARTWVQPLDKSAADLYGLCEGGDDGYYPVGAHSLWHGGVHLPAESDQVRCLADGVIIAARLPEAPDSGRPTGALGKPFSRNFVLIRHELPMADKTVVPVWSLVMHLEPFRYDAEDPKAPAPFVTSLTRYRSLRAKHGARLDGLDWSQAYYEVALAEDPQDPGAKSGAAWGLRLREDSKSRKVLAVLPPGTLARLVEVKPRGRVKVVVEPDPQVSVPAGTTFDAPLTGTIPVKAYKGKPRVRVLGLKALRDLEALRQGKVVALQLEVRAGDLLGQGEVIHVEAFSEAALHEQVTELKSLDDFQDTDNDRLVDVASLTTTIKAFEPYVGGAKAAKTAAPAGRTVAALFQSEWQVEDWSFLDELPLAKVAGGFFRKRIVNAIRTLQWWKSARAALDKRKRGGELPKSPKVWHYHPVTLVTRLQKAFTETGSLYREPPPAGLAIGADEAPFNASSFHYKAPSGTKDPRHVIFQALADTEGRYTTAQVWDTAIISLGIGQWTLIHGKAQKLLDVLRATRPADYERLIVDDLGLDLPATRREYGVPILYGGKTLRTRSTSATQTALLTRLRKNKKARGIGQIARDFIWHEFEVAFRGIDSDWEDRIRAVVTDDDYDWDTFAAVYAEVSGPIGVKRNGGIRHLRDVPQAWEKSFVKVGADPVMRQVQYELKIHDLFHFFQQKITVNKTGKRKATKTPYNKFTFMFDVDDGRYTAPLGSYGQIWKLLDGDLWLQVMAYSLWVNAPAMAKALYAGAIFAMAKARNPAAPNTDVSTWGPRSTWRDEFVTHFDGAIAACTYRGNKERPWHNSRRPKALVAYQALSGDPTAERNAPDFEGIRFDATGLPKSPKVSIDGLRLALEATAKLSYLAKLKISADAE